MADDLDPAALLRRECDLADAADPLLLASDTGAEAPDGRGHLSSATDNAEMMRRIIALYGRPGMTILDPMTGPGVFWKAVDTEAYDLHRTDIAGGGPDARSLPWGDCTVHMVVLDPPYRYVEDRTTSEGLRMAENDIYNLASLRSAPLKGHDAVMALYRESMMEAVRVLKHGGYLVVKCQDTITDGRQQWVHVDLMKDAPSLGVEVIDLAVVTPSQVPPTRWKTQRTLRKAHSYFIVYRKGGRWPFGYRSVSKR